MKEYLVVVGYCHKFDQKRSTAWLIKTSLPPKLLPSKIFENTKQRWRAQNHNISNCIINSFFLYKPKDDVKEMQVNSPSFSLRLLFNGQLCSMNRGSQYTLRVKKNTCRSSSNVLISISVSSYISSVIKESH